MQDDFHKMLSWAEKWQLPLMFQNVRYFTLDIIMHLTHISNVYGIFNFTTSLRGKDLAVLIDNQLKYHKGTTAVINKPSY